MHLTLWVCVVRCIKAYTRRLHDVGQLFRSININRDLSALSFTPLTLLYHSTITTLDIYLIVLPSQHTQSMLNPTRLYENHQIGCYFWTRNEEMFHFTQVLLALLPIFIIADAPSSAVTAAAHTNLGLGEIEVEVYFMPTWQSRREASWWRRQWRCRWCVTIFFAKTERKEELHTRRAVQGVKLLSRNRTYPTSERSRRLNNFFGAYDDEMNECGR